MGEEGCMLTMPRIPFRTGRKDCVPDQENLNNGRGYIASSKKHEVHPNPFMNGKELTEFMKVCISFALVSYTHRTHSYQMFIIFLGNIHNCNNLQSTISFIEKFQFATQRGGSTDGCPHFGTSRSQKFHV